MPCPICEYEFIYVDAFLHHFKNNAGIFIDPIHAIPIAPGYTVGGEIQVIPDDVQLISYGITYNRPPELFFFNRKIQPVRDLVLENIYVAALSISTDNFILLSRTFDPVKATPRQRIRWMSVGEIGEQEKPIWINILQNAADLILKSEDRAGLVMLQIAFDFFLDSLLGQLGLTENNVKAATRSWKISDRRAKIRMIEGQIGKLPEDLTLKLVDLAEQRNRIVHGKKSKTDSPDLTSAEAFQVIIETITSYNDLKYAAQRDKVLVEEAI
ncbi:hypothetical protein CEE37_10870 [candidate division LCP-89 bacterium B3_LCP]|uniref:Uncharacterized protein n=1 Tax=candidate division LCP-89 bacterium B3_LCP TaxID=2012998 RepID=A0A532UXV8_UNCL8|nr:MAG: hypothetical protein CEE37_10870 [candidate division LCP-89 bacterium B3_LCP]